jgi:hypothetical protein
MATAMIYPEPEKRGRGNKSTKDFATKDFSAGCPYLWHVPFSRIHVRKLKRSLMESVEPKIAKTLNVNENTRFALFCIPSSAIWART